MTQISIIGAGYVGLVSGAGLAELGHDVTCVDVDRAKVDSINRGAAPIFEKDLPGLLAAHVGKRLRATQDLEAATLSADITFIAAGTPFDGDQIDLRFIREIARQIGAALKRKPDYHVVVVKSTVVPGTTDDVVRPLIEHAWGKRAGQDFGLGVNPEFLSEGVAVEDFLSPDRIVLGGMDERTLSALDQVYAPFTDIPILRTTNKAAEMIKYASNALQATAISFANEIGNICAAVRGIDVADVMAGVHLMKELNPAAPAGSARARAGLTGFLAAGCGFGGSCFPKDLKAIAAHARHRGVAPRLLDAVLAINERQPHQVTALIRQGIGPLAGKRVAVLGLAFKPGTDDMRESPAIPIINDLLAEGAIVQAHDPAAAREAAGIFGQRLTLCESLPAAIEASDAIAIVTRWDDYLALPGLLAHMPHPPLVVDGRRMLDPGAVPRYAGIGI